VYERIYTHVEDEENTEIIDLFLLGKGERGASCIAMPEMIHCHTIWWLKSFVRIRGSNLCEIFLQKAPPWK